ncbi:ABC transporter ATP-binding protein [Muribaculaceae bacterium Isolate-110 (HZI)]|nr:ABC transporter ATP-binding protein [Muribaculum intestinale]ROT21188.1 ABC transporter ATP-binding protein [Muribaculaceae bacterium Isolate-110 (HZI)]
MTYPIDISGVTKRYGDIVALDNVDIMVEKGELFGLIGPDGAGKSSLYMILATLLAPDTGTATVCGLDTVKDFRQLRTRIGYMPEKFSLYQDLTVAENLKFFANIFGVSVKENYDFIAPIFGQLEKFPTRLAGALSGGMKQKLALGCALIHKPDILLLDEPTTGVDAVSRSELWDMLTVLKKKGITIMVSTSYMDEASRCDRIAMMNHGKILATDTTANLLKQVGGNLYAAVASDMFRLLRLLRLLPQVIDCYTFGATLHVVGSHDFNSKSIMTILEKEGVADAKIYPIKGNIEDLFIKLTFNGG